MKRITKKQAVTTDGTRTYLAPIPHRHHGIVPEEVAYLPDFRNTKPKYDAAYPVISFHIDNLALENFNKIKEIWDCSRSEALNRVLRLVAFDIVKALKQKEHSFKVNREFSLRKEDWREWKRTIKQ